MTESGADSAEQFYLFGNRFWRYVGFVLGLLGGGGSILATPLLLQLSG